MMKAVKLSFGMVLVLGLVACTSTPKPTYVSPTQYQSLDCRQLQAEYNRLYQHLETGVTPAKRTGVGVGVGIGGGWGSRGGWGLGPTVSVNMGQSSNSKKTEISRLMGEQEAIVQAAKFKNCPILIRKSKN